METRSDPSPRGVSVSPRRLRDPSPRRETAATRLRAGRARRGRPGRPAPGPRGAGAGAGPTRPQARRASGPPRPRPRRRARASARATLSRLTVPRAASAGSGPAGPRGPSRDDWPRAPRGPRPVLGGGGTCARPSSARRGRIRLIFAALECWYRPLEGRGNAKINRRHLRSAGVQRERKRGRSDDDVHETGLAGGEALQEGAQSSEHHGSSAVAPPQRLVAALSNLPIEITYGGSARLFATVAQASSEALQTSLSRERLAVRSERCRTSKTRRTARVRPCAPRWERTRSLRRARGEPAAPQTRLNSTGLRQGLLL